jgi:hypothetical protein
MSTYSTLATFITLTFKSVKHFGPSFTVPQMVIGTHLLLDVTVYYSRLRNFVRN